MSAPVEGVRVGRRKSTQKAEAILRAAEDLFLAQGFQGTSMDAVARAACVSKQTVYSHFANKEALFTACITAKVASYGFDETMTFEDVDLRDGLLSLCRRFVDLLFDPEVIAMHRIVMAEAASQPRIAQLFVESGPKRTKATVGGYLRRQVARGRLRIDDERFFYASVQLLNMVVGMYQLELWMGLRDSIPKDELDRHLERVVDDFLTLYTARGQV